MGYTNYHTKRDELKHHLCGNGMYKLLHRDSCELERTSKSETSYSQEDGFILGNGSDKSDIEHIPACITKSPPSHNPSRVLNFSHFHGCKNKGLEPWSSPSREEKRGEKQTLQQTCFWCDQKRNMRSKIRWLTRFCNSHYVSHFAAFFIVVGAKTSIAESAKKRSFEQRNATQR